MKGYYIIESLRCGSQRLTQNIFNTIKPIFTNAVICNERKSSNTKTHCIPGQSTDF